MFESSVGRVLGFAMGVLLLSAGMAVADVAGYTGGIDLDGVKCRNTTDPQLVFDYRTGLDTFDCGSAGMTTSPGDRYFLKIQGSAGAPGSGSIGVEITSDHTLDRVGCRNNTTGQRLFLFLPEDFTGFYDCTAAGFTASEGDAILLQAGGVRN